MNKRLEPEPELRLLLEDYPKARSRPSAGESTPSFESPEPNFLPESTEERMRRWLAEAQEGTQGPGAAPDDTPLRLLVEDFHPAERFRERNRETKPAPPAEPGPEPNFLVAWDADAAGSKRAQTARAASFALHLTVILVAVLQPRIEFPSEPTEPDLDREYARISLAPPSPELLERITPQARGDEGEVGRPAVAAAPEAIVAPAVAQRPTPPPPLQPVVPEQEPEPEPEAIAEEPDPEAEQEAPSARTRAPGEFQLGPELAEAPQQQPTTQAPPQEQPQLRLENPSAYMPAPEGPTQIAELRPTRGREALVEAAISQAAEQGPGRQAVGDGVGASAIGTYSAPSRGDIGSGVELLSDPEGVDFRPYLLQILNSVRRNWFAVIPESARLGVEKGRVALQFSIDRTGAVPKLVIATSSRSQPLDRASVAGVSASLPFPPLPTDFRGQEIRVQFVFLYNTKP